MISHQCDATTNAAIWPHSRSESNNHVEMADIIVWTSRQSYAAVAQSRPLAGGRASESREMSARSRVVAIWG